MKFSNSGFGQEISKNNWEIKFQNSYWLLLVSFICGLIITFIIFALLAPKDSFSILHWYFASWLSCKVPFACSPEAVANMRALQPSIDRIGGLLNFSKFILAVSTAGSFLGLRYYFQQQGQKFSSEKFLRGAKFLLPHQLQAIIDEKYPETEFDLEIGRERIRLPEFLSFRHISFAGASGTGKTQGISKLLAQLQQKRRQKCLILDLNGQYYSKFAREGDIVLSLYDQRSRAWNFWSEDVPAEFLAEALIEDGEQDKFFAPAGRALLTDLLRINSNIESLWQDLISQPKDLIQRLKGGISPALIGADEQAAGVQATALLKLNFLQHLNHWCKDSEVFQLTEWCQDQRENWVFLIVRDRDLAPSKPLLRTWIDLTTLGILQREEDQEYPHFWLIADELAGLGKLPTLGKLLSQGRKYQATALVGYQTSGQIEDIYGKEGAQEILQGLQNKLVFRCSDADTAKKASLELGEQDLEEVATTIQFGQLATNDRNSLNRSIKTRPVVMASEIQNLPDLQAYIKLADLNPSKIHFDYQKYPQINQANNSEIPPSRLQGSNANSDTSLEDSDAEYDFDPNEYFDEKEEQAKQYNFDSDPEDEDENDNFLPF